MFCFIYEAFPTQVRNPHQSLADVVQLEASDQAKLQTNPHFAGLLFDSTLLLIILLLLGVGAGFRNMFYMIMKEVKRAEAEAEAEAEE